MPHGEGRRAWYASARGGWRDWLNLLHLPYTVWHLSYVVIGAGLADRLDDGVLAATLVAFGLAVGVAAHALDEIKGRPLATAIPDRHLAWAAALSLAAAAAIGIAGIWRVGWPLALFITAGLVLVAGYNLEMFGGRLHSDVVFAAAWGAFPVLTSYYAQTQTMRPAPIAASVFAFGLSWAQRTLSIESRSLRRDVRTVIGERIHNDGTRHRLDREILLEPMDRTLRTLSWSVVALAVALALH